MRRTTSEVIAEYLTAALEDSNPDVFLMAVRDVVRARGIAQLARDAGMGRESLYKALAPGEKPRPPGLPTELTPTSQDS